MVQHEAPPEPPEVEFVEIEVLIAEMAEAEPDEAGYLADDEGEEIEDEEESEDEEENEDEEDNVEEKKEEREEGDVSNGN